ncbi:MAG: hypothetical protein VXY42_02880 [Candidatus Thermoplasmatota archaeon]|nr:hypothetical protein [Candidatus Thermoplasmatota archaeon]MEC8609431.1 hypothetical protein [Candidatus Thermoplasmatota archaeon]
MGFLRNTIALAFVATLLFYFITLGQLEENQQWIVIGTMVVLGLVFILSGSPSFELPAQPGSNPAPVQQEVASESQEEAISNEESTPETGPTKTMTLKERKAAKILAAQEAQRAAMSASNGDNDESMHELPIVEVETVHVADEYVVEVSPESVEEADIQLTVKERASKHSEIRARIEARRRSQMADIRASTSRMWEENVVREDLVSILQNEGHGLTVLDEPLNPDPGHIYGATFIRIDDQRILKYRSQLDSGFEAVISNKPEPEALLSELPPLIGPDGNPLPLPDLPSPSGALAALKMEMDED